MFEMEEQNDIGWQLDTEVEEQDTAEAELPEQAMEVEEQEAELQEEAPKVDTEVDIQDDTAEADDQDVSSRIEGTVKWFSNPKGYGFISREGGEDVFVHYSEIQGSGFRSLSAGERVEFALKQSEKGPRAVEVRSLETTVGSGWL